jgi:ABC-type amino acid transport substrate-binding protein
MNTPVDISQLAAPIPPLGDAKKKRVLLIDTSNAKRDLRAEVMRKLGIDVDIAADIAEARSWWRAALYDLVLVNMEKGRGHRDRFCDDVRRATPPQQLAFLVGKPGYLAHAPNSDEEFSTEETNGHSFSGDVKAALSADLGGFSQRWGILEASRRISAVRSASNARTQAMRNRPLPPRDPEGLPERRPSSSTTLDDLLREELR